MKELIDLYTVDREHDYPLEELVLQKEEVAGDKVVFPGTFKAEVTERAERTGRNPQTGEEMVIPAKKAIKAKFSDKLLG